ncbi:MAG: carboxypeptidase regulatory-like domain-containing protein, partial [Candidatus Cloacimonetes bacterium]|nr:carboxypeptidase regulatory-like domain-containing protein [Candidatus Cloacimonadota bacterium]
MNYKKVFIFIVFAVALLTSTAFAEDPLQTGIQGNVSLSGGSGDVQDVTIEIIGTGVTENPYNPSGDYALTIGAGTYDVEFSLYGYYSHTENDVVVVQDQITTLPNVTLNHIPYGNIEGTVILNGGDPQLINQVTFLLDGVELPGVHPQINGNYFIGYIEAGLRELTAQLEGYYDSTATVNVTDGGTATQDFTLNARPGTIIGFVTLNGDGAVNLVDFEVKDSQTGIIVTPIDIIGPLVYFNGYYEIIIQPGTYDVTASLIDFEPQTIEDIQVIYNQATDEQNFTLNKYPFIEGVVDLTGGTGDVKVVVVEADDTTGTGDPYIVTPDENGYYVIPNMDFGSYEVIASLAGYEEVTPVTIVVDAYIVYTQNFTLVPSDAVISGEVEITGGTGLYTNVLVQYQIDGGAWINANYNPGTHLYDVTLSYIGVTNPQDVKVKATLADYGDDENEYTDVIQADEYPGKDLKLDPDDIIISGEITLNGGWIKQNVPEITVTSNYGTVTGDPNADSTAYEYIVTITHVHYEDIFNPLDVQITARHLDYYPQTINLTVEQGDIVPDQDMTLDAKPGFITGTLTPVGGDPQVNLTQAWVRAWENGILIHGVHPNQNGDYELTIPIAGHDMPPQYTVDIKTELVGFINGEITDVIVNENETTIDQDFDLVSVKVNAIVTIDAGAGPVGDVVWDIGDLNGNPISPYSITSSVISPDSAEYWIDIDPGDYNIEATLLGYDGDYRSITKLVTLQPYIHVTEHFDFTLDDPIVQDLYLSQDAKDNLQSIYHWIKKDGTQPEEFIAPEVHAVIKGSPAAQLDSILFEYQDITTSNWIEIGVIAQPSPSGIIYDVYVDWDPLPVVGNYPIKVTCWDTTVTRTNPVSQIIYRDVRNVLLDYDRSDLTYSTETVGPNIGNNILHNADAALTVAVLGTPDDIAEVDSVKIDVVNRVGGAVLASVTSNYQPYPIGSDSTWTWNFAYLIDDILLAAGGVDKVNVDFNVALFDITDTPLDKRANWTWIEVPLFEDIWIDAQDPVLPGYDQISITNTSSGQSIDITNLILPSNNMIEVKLEDCFDALTHIDNVDLLYFY